LLRSRKTKILTTGILVVFRGLKFESDPREIGSAFHGAGADIDGKDSFRSGTIYYRETKFLFNVSAVEDTSNLDQVRRTLIDKFLRK